MKRRLLSLMLSTVMGTMLLAGCGSAASETADQGSGTATTEVADEETATAVAPQSGELSGELNIVHYLSEPQKIAALDEMVTGFEAEYPGVNVNLESTTLENYQDVLKLKFSTGDVPDVVFGGPKTYSTFVTAGNIEDLTGKDFVSRVQQNTLQNVEIDGKVYGIPLDVLANAVLYNKDIFNEVGLEVLTTYSEFIDCCKKLEEAGYVGCTN